MSFVRRKDEIPPVHKKFFDGAGEGEVHPILTGADEMYGKGRLFSHTVLPVGAEIGWHVHHGDGETYYILRGHGEYSDNGTVVEVGPGDTTFVGDGEGHSLKNTGDEPLEAIAMILYC